MKNNPRTLEESLEILNELPEIGTLWIKQPFAEKYESEIKKKIWDSEVGDKVGQMPDYYRKEGYEKYGIMTDEPLLEGENRGEVIDLRQVVENLLEDDDPVTVLTNRSTEDVITVSSTQAAQDLVDYMIANKVTGITLDW